MSNEVHAVAREARRPLLRAALWSGGGLLALLGLYSAALWLPFRDPGQGTQSELEALRRRPPGPPTGGREQAGYGWVDRGAGVVTLPVEEAMKVQADRLPVREGAARARDERARRQVPTDAGSGRYPRRGRR